jgi:tripartite-type tricarboxylate transporter receptor subunit TctC
MQPLPNLLVGMVFCVGAHAQYPSKPIRWIVPTAAGGAFDLVPRGIAPLVAQQLGQPVVVENRPGASGILGAEWVARAAPDGYTALATGNTQLSLVKFTHASLPYDPQKDFAPVSLIGDPVSALFVHSSVPVTTVRELVDYAKKNPNKLNYGSAGIGHTFHLATELFKQRTGTEMVHVPFKGTAPALQDLFAGRIQVMFYGPNAQMLSQVAAGKLRVVGAEVRTPQVGEVPTFRESGLGNLETPGWLGLAMPAATPREIIARMNTDLRKAMATPQAAKALADFTLVDVSGTPEQMARRIAEDVETWGPIIKAIGIKPE